jgi:hypothetical protein
MWKGWGEVNTTDKSKADNGLLDMEWQTLHTNLRFTSARIVDTF